MISTRKRQHFCIDGLFLKSDSSVVHSNIYVVCNSFRSWQSTKIGYARARYINVQHKTIISLGNVENADEIIEFILKRSAVVLKRQSSPILLHSVFLWTFIAWARRRRWSLLVQRQHRQTLRTWEAACNEKTKIGQQDCSNFNGGKQLQRDEDHDNCNGKASALQFLRSRVQQRLCQLR